MFQSAPAPKDGRCLPQALPEAPASLFQSAPAPKDGRCRHTQRIEVMDDRVSIRARPEGRAMPEELKDLHLANGVSIRARPEGRAMP